MPQLTGPRASIDPVANMVIGVIFVIVFASLFGLALYKVHQKDQKKKRKDDKDQ